ncbi:MAG: AbrB/MazE/SpoVT family DNA-binding domain-containing protein [Gemmatimonadetes bacterium]|nr:AbrB/MazE/SpoVT family DNA-binding domain-containing protein [Gemmatimonadota bacterium]
MLHRTKLDLDGTIDLPDELLQKLGWKPGDWLEITFEDGAIVITRAKPAEGEPKLSDSRGR